MSSSAPVRSIEIPPAAGRVRDRRTGRRRGVRLAMGMLLVAVLSAEFVLAGPSIVSAAGAAAASSVGWLAAATGAAVASMVAFAAVRRRTLRAAGVGVPLRQAVAVSYAAGALHTSLPGGTVLSTAYAFRHLRGWGASTTAATWSLAVTGLLATATLSVIGLSGILLGGATTGSVVQSIAAICVVLAGMAGIVRLTRRPDRLGLAAGNVLRRINRLRRRPAETGYAVLATVIDDLQAIRPSRRAWLDAWTLSLLNWVLDVACLAACCAALGLNVGFAALLITYTAGMAASSLTAVPGGLGVVEAALTVGLTTAGVPLTGALGAVLVYRILSLGGVVVIGWTVLAVQRLRAGAAPRTTHRWSLTPGNPWPTNVFRTFRPIVAGAAGPRRGGPPTVVDGGSSRPGRTSRPARSITSTSGAVPSGRAEHPDRHGRLVPVTRAREVMTSDPDRVALSDSWQRVARTMRTLRAASLPVCDDRGDLCGIVDYQDIGLRCLAEGGSPATARSLARTTPFTIGVDDPLDGVPERMAQQRVWLLPVLDGRRLAGVIHYADILASRISTPPPVALSAA